MVHEESRHDGDPPDQAAGTQAHRAALRRLFDAGADIHFTLALGPNGGCHIVDAEDGARLETLIAAEAVQQLARTAADTGRPVSGRTGPVEALEGRTFELRFAPLRDPNAESVLVSGAARTVPAAVAGPDEELFYQAFRLGPTALAISRLEDGQLIDVNEQYEALTGYPREDLLGAASLDRSLWPDPDARAAFRARLRAGERAVDGEYALRRADGTIRTVAGTHRLLEMRGEPCVLTAVSDVTDRTEGERELIAAKEQAEESARMRNAFLTNMTHEVRTPLTVILGFTSMLRQGVRPEYRRFVRVIERSGRRLLLMLDSILDLAQLEVGALEVVPESVNIVSAVEHAVGEVRPLAEEKNLGLDADLPPEPLYTFVDHRLLLRVLTHVLDNAIKFTDQGSIAVAIETDASTIRVNVRDTGVGIDEAFLPHVFEEFAQESTGLERTHQGSGLGLTVASRLVELLGGTIQVESQKGQGSLFIIALPLDADVK